MKDGPNVQAAEVSPDPLRWWFMSPPSIPYVDLRGTPRAAIVGDDQNMRHQAAGLLDAAGFAVADGDRFAPGTVLVALSRRSDATRQREIRDLVDAHDKCPVLAIVPAGAGNPSLRRVLIAGATGIVIDSELKQALGATARAVAAGQLVVPRSLSGQIAPRPLSHREKQILSLVMRGLTNREIANELFLAESTVKTHLSTAFRKIDARSRAEAVARIQDPESGYGTGILAIADSAAAVA